MRFGIFYEHQLPRPWAPGDEHRLLTDALEQVELADRIATLDLLSDGRVEFGTGESSSEAELGGFGIAREDKRAQWGEALEVVTRMLVEEPFAGHQGKFIEVPPRNVVPKPLQRPHPPLWVACSRRETIHLAATKGIGALSFSFIEPPRAKEWVDDYYATIASEACVPAGFALNPQVACVLPLMCHEDEETAIDRGLDGAHFFGYALAHYYVFGTHRPGVTNIWEEFQANRSSFGFDRQIAAQTGVELGAQLLQEGLGSLRGAIGTPAQIRDLIRGYQAAGVDQLVFVSQAGRTRHEHICESLELFAAEVMPEFAEHADEHDQAKAERLAGAREAGTAIQTSSRCLALPAYSTVSGRTPRTLASGPSTARMTSATVTWSAGRASQ